MNESVRILVDSCVRVDNYLGNRALAHRQAVTRGKLLNLGILIHAGEIRHLHHIPKFSCRRITNQGHGAMTVAGYKPATCCFSSM